MQVQRLSTKLSGSKHFNGKLYLFFLIHLIFSSNLGQNISDLKVPIGSILKYEGKDASNVPSYSFVKVNGEYPVNTFDTNYYYGETWKLQVGVKYSF